MGLLVFLFITQEMEELLKRMELIEKLSTTEDHLDFLLRFPSLTTPPPTRDCSGISVEQQEETARQAVHTMVNDIFTDKSRQVEELKERVHALQIFFFVMLFFVFIVSMKK